MLWTIRMRIVPLTGIRIELVLMLRTFRSNNHGIDINFILTELRIHIKKMMRLRLALTVPKSVLRIVTEPHAFHRRKQFFSNDRFIGTKIRTRVHSQ
jgi:hypothetical protein